VITVGIAASADDDLCAAVAHLLPQVSSSAPAPTPEQLGQLVGDPATTLLVARDSDSDTVVGMLTVAVFRVPSGVRAWIEDVVVDDGARGYGVATALVTAALEHAATVGARTVDLTSRPGREAANRLYRRLGFARRETNVYRYDVKPPAR
jgi:ribosomal protein S18 acetylase RimI-like enzyme